MTDRGQLLLAGAFVFAVAIIGLTLVFSASNVTTAVATDQTAAAQGDHAIAIRESLKHDLGRYLDRLNSQPLTFAERNATFTNVTENISARIREEYTSSGRFVNLSANLSLARTYNEGYKVWDDRNTTFINGTNGNTSWVPRGPDDWNITKGRPVRNVTFQILAIDDRVNPATGERYDDERPFTIQFNATSGSGPPSMDKWNISIDQSAAATPTWRVTVTGQSPGGGYRAECLRPVPDNEMTIDISAATVEGKPCHALEAIDVGDRTYDLDITNGGSAMGKFWLLVNDTSIGSPDSIEDHLLTPRRNNEALFYDAGYVYSATVYFEYRTAMINYATPIRLAPGEIR